MVLGYSTTSRVYRVYNIRTHIVEESINVAVVDLKTTHEQRNLSIVLSNTENESSCHLKIEKSQEDQEEHSSQSSSEDDFEEIQPQPKNKRFTKGLSRDDIIGDPNIRVKTRREIKNIISHLCFTSKIESKCVKEAISDPYWIMAMQEEQNQFQMNDVWFFIERPTNKNVIDTKWILKNKHDEHGTVTINKAKLIAKPNTGH